MTTDEIRVRLREANDTLRRLPFPKGGAPSRKVTAWPDVVHDYWAAYGREAVKVTRLKPTMQEIDRLDEVLPWFFLIADRRQRAVVWLRAVPLSWRKIGRIVGVSHETARGLEDVAVETIARRIA